MQRIVLASNNAGKLKEFQKLFAPLNIDVVPQKDFNISDADETGTSFSENALLKARHAAKLAGLPAIADDSGIVIDALNGEPGIYSARYAGTHGDSAANIKKVLHKLQHTPPNERQAHFHCCLAFVRDASDPNPIIVSADWHGEILTAVQGGNGFGYDPIFYVATHHCSAAEMDSELKNQISHRAKATQKLLAALQPIMT